MKKENEIRLRAVGALKGVPFGDMHGLSTECMSPSQIRMHFGYVNKLVSNKHHKFSNVAKQPKGTISDDSQLTLAIMDSLRRSGGYDLDDIKKAHVEAWQGKWGQPIGWGGSSKRSVIAYEAGEWVPPTVEAAGNAPPMKITGLAIYAAYKCRKTPHKKFTNSFNASLLKKCREITLFTHGDPRCIVAAYCQARTTIRAIQDEIPLFPMKIAQMFIDDAKWAESKLNVTWETSHDGFTVQMLSERMEDVFDIGCDIDDDQTWGVFKALDCETAFVSKGICTQKSSFIMNSYPFVAYCVAKYLPYRDFNHAIWETINGGADADSNGAMVGAIMGGMFPSQVSLMGAKRLKMISAAINNFESDLWAQ